MQIGIFAEFVNQWEQLRPGYNWRTFHPIMIEVEDDRHLGAVEATFVLLGLGIRVRWNYTETEDTRMIDERIAEIDAESYAQLAAKGKHYDRTA